MESAAPYFALLGMRGLGNPTDDLRLILKDAAGQKFIDFENFDNLPQITFISGSLQYGAGRSPDTPWVGQRRIHIEKTGVDLSPKLEPDGRTRQGLVLNAKLEAPFANWNPRAALSLRSPIEDFHQVEEAPAGAGIYQPFKPAADSNWNDRFPFESDGRQHLDPLGRGRTTTSTILFDVPGKDAKLTSLGFFQHAKLSELVWHPSRPIGNSLADPRIPPDRTLPEERDKGGFIHKHIGLSADPDRSPHPDAWTDAANSMLQEIPDDGGQFIYDLSYEANHILWDHYFLSGSDEDGKNAFARSPLAHPLPNALLLPSNEGDRGETSADLKDFHRAASRLKIQGAFNVNSLSEKAWASVLAANRRKNGEEATTAFNRVAGTKFRELTDPEIRELASAIVREVKQRGPFLGMADFVNRRLAQDETGEEDHGDDEGD
ncbi:MAG: hypothetical protein EOP85_07205, partial [Verrucomicrobiaceae bacterium]